MISRLSSIALALLLIVQTISADSFDVSTCGVSKSCFVPLNDDCWEGCGGLRFSYKILGTTKMQVEFSKSVNDSTGFYAAVGFSDDDAMGNYPVLECSSLGTQAASLKWSYNEGTTNIRIAGASVITDSHVTFENGVVYCTGIVDVTGGTDKKQFKYVPNTEYYLLMAYGPTSDSALLHHIHDTNTNNPVKLEQIQNVVSTIDLSGCGTSMGCFIPSAKECYGKPEGVIFTYARVNASYFHFQLLGKGSADGFNDFVAVGFSSDKLMGGSNVIECSSIGSDPYSMKFSYNNESPRNVRIDGEEKIESTYFVGTSIKSEDGRLYCKTKVNVGGWDGSGQVFKWDSNQNYYVLIAKGPTTGSAILMILAWICFIPTALLFARFLRNSWPMYKPGGLLIWFHVHRTCNMLGICMMIASFVCIMCQNKWKWSGPGSNEPKWQKVHTMVGLIALVLAWLQPFISTMRCSPNDQRRPIFNWIHRGIGTIAFILAITAMAIAGDQFTGIWSNNGVQLGLILAALGVVVVMCCIFPVLDHMESRKTTDHKSWERLRQLFVLIALLFLFGDGIALSVLVGVGKPAM